MNNGSWRGDVPISTAPAVDPAMIDRKALGLSFFFSTCALAIENVRDCVDSQYTIQYERVKLLTSDEL
jgi:hypothetical protein